jgi:hypothetical protein
VLTKADKYCNATPYLASKNTCGTILIKNEDITEYEQWECLTCGNIEENDFPDKFTAFGEKSSKERVSKEETRGRQKTYNLQHLWQILQEQDFPKKISRWKRKLTREQKEFIDIDTLKRCQGEVELLKQRMDDYFNIQ